MKKFFLLMLLMFSIMLVQRPVCAHLQNTDDLYLDRLQKKVELNWIIPEEKSAKSTVIRFKIDYEGQILNTQMIRSSGDPLFDERALMSIYKSAPFERFDEGVSYNTLTLDFFFNSKMAIMDVADNAVKGNIFTGTKLVNTANNDIDIACYLRNFQDKIKSNWNQSVYQNDRLMISVIEVDKKGFVRDLEIVRSSGDKDFDKEALNAMNSSVPFDSLPDKIDTDSIKLQFSFFYSALRSVNNDQYNTACAVIGNNSDLVQNYATYKKEIEEILASNSLNSRYYKNRDVLIKFTMDNTGALISAEVEKSSGNKKFDNKILSDVQKCSFPPIPASLNRQSLLFYYFVTTKKNKVSSLSDFGGDLFAGWTKELTSTCVCDNNITPVIKFYLSNKDDFRTKDGGNKVIRDAIFDPYIQALHKKIKSNWHSSLQNRGKKTVIAFNVDTDGELKNVEIVESSGDEKFDNDALDAIIKSAPFDSFPKEFQGGAIAIKYTFINYK